MAGFETYTRTLIAPLVIDGTERTEITIQEPTVDMLEELEDVGYGVGVVDDKGEPVLNDKGEQVAKPIGLREIRRSIEILAGVPADSLRGMHNRDFKALSEQAGPLLGRSDSPDDPPKSAAPSASEISSSTSSVSGATS
jgi:hypothetical protein